MRFQADVVVVRFAQVVLAVAGAVGGLVLGIWLHCDVIGDANDPECIPVLALPTMVVGMAAGALLPLGILRLAGWRQDQKPE
ncbi:MAG: hypothetical protein RIE08_06090 [Acidimicrobiales bacterium]